MPSTTCLPEKAQWVYILCIFVCMCVCTSVCVCMSMCGFVYCVLSCSLGLLVFCVDFFLLQPLLQSERHSATHFYSAFIFYILSLSLSINLSFYSFLSNNLEMTCVCVCWQNAHDRKHFICASLWRFAHTDLHCLHLRSWAKRFLEWCPHTDLEMAFAAHTCQGFQPALYGFVMSVIGLVSTPMDDNSVMDCYVMGVDFCEL